MRFWVVLEVRGEGLATKEARVADRASIMRGVHGGALQAAMPVVTGGLHSQCRISHTVAVPSLRSAAPCTVNGESLS